MAGRCCRLDRAMIENNSLKYRSKKLCDNTKNAGPKVDSCKETNLTAELMKTKCHGDYHCQVNVNDRGKFLRDADCFKPKKELNVNFICGNISKRILKMYN